MASPQDAYQCGLIGLGAISSYYINAIHSNSRTCLFGVCSLEIEAKDKSRFPECKVVSNDHMTLLVERNLELVFIATPPSSHSFLISACIEQQKYRLINKLPLLSAVIVEKPLTTTYDEARQILQDAENAMLPLFFSYHAAMNPLALRAENIFDNWLNQGDTFKKFEVLWKEDVRKYHGGNSWVFEKKISGGGCLMDSGINCVSAVEQLLDCTLHPISVELKHEHPTSSVETSALVLFEAKPKKMDQTTKIPGTLTQNWLWEGPETREIKITFLSGRTIVFDYSRTYLTISNSPDSSENKTERPLMKKSQDVNEYPMALEYVNVLTAVVKFADQCRQTSYRVSHVGLGPLRTIFECYLLEKHPQRNKM